MSIQIIADSCCDTSPELQKQLGIDLVPLTIHVPESDPIVDIMGVNTDNLLQKIEASREPTHSSCPSPIDFMKRMEKYEESIVITLSKFLSGTYNIACVARDLVLENFPNKKITIVDSGTATAGETLIALYVDRLRRIGESFESISRKAQEYVQRSRTLLVLEDLRTIIKNGRMSKVKGIVASVLSLYPILGDDGQGEIMLVKTVRGFNNALNRMVDTVKELTDSNKKKSLPLVLSHCQCPERAQNLKKDLLERCPALSEVIIVPTSGLSSMYASRGGVVIAF